MKKLNQQMRYIVASVLLLLLVMTGVLAQSTPATILAPGEAVSGTLTPEILSQIYFFTGESGQAVQLVATSRDGLIPVLLLTDLNGAKLAEVADNDSEGTVRLEATLPLPGTYYVTVFSAPGALVSEGQFELLLVNEDTDLSAEATPAPVEATLQALATAQALATDAPTVVEETSEPAATLDSAVVVPDDNLVGSALTFQPSQDVLLNSGIRVDLTWNTPVDLNLEIRDPLGNSVYFDQTTSPVGAQFGPDSNGLCEIVRTDPAENVTWSSGFLPTGNYEILVFYRETCDTSVGTTDFTLTVTVDGQPQEPIVGRIAPPIGTQSSVYIAGFTILPDGQPGALNAGGIYPDSAIDELAAPVAEVAAIADDITRDVPVTGTIVGTQYYQAYAFNGLANESVSVTLENSAGNLDTLLQIVNSSGLVVAANDDAEGTRNSALTNVRLINTDTYYLIATRYGKDLGSTEGEFAITLTGLTEDITTSTIDLTSLGLSDGDTQVLLTWNTTADLQLLVRDPVGDSVFDDVPQVGSGGILEANGNVDCTVTSATPVSYIYWPEGFLRPGTYEIEVWFQQDCGDTTPVQFELTTIVDGELIISEQRNPTLGRRYVISFDIAPDGSTTVRPGGLIGVGAANIPYTQQSATAIQVNQTASSQIIQEDFFDVYTLDAIAGQTVTINMVAAPGSTLDTRLILLAPDGQLAAENDDVTPGENTNSSITSFVIPFDGVYTIIATRYAGPFGGTTGSYSMTVAGG